MKVALVHDWITSEGGGEKTLKEIYELFPGPIHTLLYDLKSHKESFFKDKELKASFIQKIPFGCRAYRYFLPLFPMAVETFNLSAYDLVISSSHCVAKGVLTHADQLHICYCHTPMRYAWDPRLAPFSSLVRPFALPFLHYLRMWDIASSKRVDHFIANSLFVARRLKKIYGREAQVIYPPVTLDPAHFSEKKEDYYLIASRLVPYKKVDLVLEAFAQMPQRQLIVIGEGPELKRLFKMRKKNIQVLGYQSEAILKSYLTSAKAVIHMALEDFGIFPVEAQGCGTPVIAYGKGGVLETVIPEKTGIFMEEQTSRACIAAVEEFETKTFDPYFIYNHAERFNAERFKREFKHFIEEKIDER